MWVNQGSDTKVFLTWLPPSYGGCALSYQVCFGKSVFKSTALRPAPTRRSLAAKCQHLLTDPLR